MLRTILVTHFVFTCYAKCEVLLLLTNLRNRYY